MEHISKEIKTFGKRLTSKQANLIEEITENSGEPIGKLMINAGYSPNTANKPNQILKSLPFRELFNQKISSKLVLNAHKKLLNAKVRVRTYQKGELKTEYITEDTLGISKGVDLAYKVMGAFAPIETKHTITGLESKSDAELEELLKEEQNSFDRASKYKPKVIEGELANVSTPA